MHENWLSVNQILMQLLAFEEKVYKIEVVVIKI